MEASTTSEAIRCRSLECCQKLRGRQKNQAAKGSTFQTDNSLGEKKIAWYFVEKYAELFCIFLFVFSDRSWKGLSVSVVPGNSVDSFLAAVLEVFRVRIILFYTVFFFFLSISITYYLPSYVCLSCCCNDMITYDIAL